jgi:carboxylate-amine ligase
MEFKSSKALTMGIELELQVLNRRDCDLTRGAEELITLIERFGHPGEVKPEMTDSMIEISTSVHERYDTVLQELRTLRDVVVRAADKLNVLVAGGGAHPFQHWAERKIYDKPRFQQLSTLYGYLAKQFTIFGQHVHIGCPEGDSAIHLLHGLSRYIPHFIALAASSPYHQGVDTAFDSSRLNSVFAFPLSGRAPVVENWSGFVDYFQAMQSYGIVESMKDFYWDIRPKPEYGTVEIRVFDTPLTVDRAAVLAAYTQTLARYLLIERPYPVNEERYRVYTYNRFQACRFGLDGFLIDPDTKTNRSIREDILATVELLRLHARELQASDAVEEVARSARDTGNDASWLRAQYARSESLADLAWRTSQRWSGRA